MRKDTKLVDLFAAVAMTANRTSPVIPIQDFDNCGVQLVWTGTPTGTFAVDVSNDYNAATNVPGTWTALTLTGPPAAAGSASNGFIDLNQLSAAFVRVRYVFGSGTGSLSGKLCAKAL